MGIQIKSTTIEEVHAITLTIPEFINPHAIEEYKKRLNGVPHLILAAYDGNKIVGFKIGYEREAGAFYSWMGAVLPEYRQRGIAKALSQVQENWAKKQGYPKIWFKTKNRLRKMLLFAIKNDFNIIHVDKRVDIGEHRIWLEKAL